MRKFVGLLAVLGLAAGWARGEEYDLVVITPHNAQIQEEFESAFSRHVGRPVRTRWIKQGTSELLQMLQAKQRDVKDGSFDIDVFFGGGIDHEVAAARGYLERPNVAPEVLAGLPAEIAGCRMHSPDGLSYAAALSTFGIFVNARALAAQNLPEVSTWADLAHPRMASWVIIADPRKSASVHVCYEAILQHHGWEQGWPLLMQLAANSRTIADSSSGVPNEVASGNALAGPCVDFYAHARMDQSGGEILRFISPKDGSAMTPDPISMLRKPPHKELAEKFFNFVLSPEGQQLWILRPGQPGGPQKYSLYRTAVRADVYARHAMTSPFEELISSGASRFDISLQKTRVTALAELMGAALVDQHDDLKAAWAAAVRAGESSEAMREWRKPLLSSQDLLNASQAIDQGGRDKREIVRKWRGMFAEKYAAVKRLGK